MNLKTETNHPAIEKLVLKQARRSLRTRKITAFYEHGQWWVENVKTGSQYSVVDEAYPGGEFKGFGFEQVTEGEL